MRAKIKYTIAGVALLVAGGFLVAATNPDFNLGRNIEIMINMFREISKFYVEEVDPDEMMQNAALGVSSGLDPYTEYLSAEEMEQFEVMTTGKYGGIGSMIRQKGDYVIIAQPYKGSPADKAGLTIGDKIVGIEGQDARGFSNEKVSSMLKGDPGTNVHLKIEKFFTGEVVPVTVRRERISIPGVPYHGFVGDSIGYIHHNDFTENCSDELLAAYMEMKRTGRLKGLILDYRNNGGGILQEAVKIMSFFTPKGTGIVSMRGRTDEMTKTYVTENSPVDLDIPIVVLTNRGSASAAEIVAGAFQDLDRGVLMGQRSFGKGLVQGTRPLGYNSYLKITIAKYYMPSGRCIQAIDYAHRNEDGSVGTVPDSLINEFNTRNGRKVYDGGGVMPDVVLEPEYISNFAVVAYNRSYIDDFVDEYVRANPTPVDPSTFSLTEVGYGAFVKFMEDKDMEFTSETKAALEALKVRAERELYYDALKEDIGRMEQAIKDDKASNLMRYRDQLTELIEAEIVLRFNYSEGVSQYKLRHDPEIAAAAALLADREQYEQILATRDTKRK